LLTTNAQGEVTGESTIPVELLQRNDLFKVVPGERIATDGLVLYGRSNVDESMITGTARLSLSLSLRGYCQARQAY